MKKTVTYCLSILLGCGILSLGLSTIRPADRYVSVKGLSEKPVKADQGTWKITFSVKENSLQQAIQTNRVVTQIVQQFLIQNGLAQNEFRPGIPSVIENTNYQTGQTTSLQINNEIDIITSHVETLQAIASKANLLLEKGVPLNGWQKPQFHFNNLSSIKPQMIEEATLDARKAAEKFAQDSGGKVGKIKRASQGYFSFKGESSGAPEKEQISKVARVVINIDYLLN